MLDVIVIGSGIVGLSASRELLLRHPGLRLCLLEKEEQIAQHQTGRNSGVLHTGLYYRPGSLKAKNCARGRAAMVAFCAAEAIPHEICGKVIVATSESELPALAELERRALENGVSAKRLDAPELREREPRARGIAALLVPDAGIVDYSRVSHRLSERVRSLGGEIRFATRVVEMVGRNDHVVVQTNVGPVSARSIVNCAGLQSDRVARFAGMNPELAIVPFRGEYFQLVGEAKSWVRHLIYPVPNPDFPFLGVHFTRDASGEVECGPNAVLNLGREVYEKWHVDPTDLGETLLFPGFLRLCRKHFVTGLSEMRRSMSKRAFAEQAARLLPGLRPEHLKPAPFGIRAQAVSLDGRLIDDFSFLETEFVLSVVNAPSPAATSSLEIAKIIADRWQTMLRR
jgi:L-2-hydroxyglutarate oxidase LhgO